MPSITDQRAQLDELTTFKFIATAFTEASAAKLKKIRAMFEVNKQFYDEIGHVYHLVRINAARLHMKLPNVSEEKEKSLSIALTSNLRFYGALNIEIVRKFVSDSEHDRSDRLIIGTTGRDYLKSTGFKKAYDLLLFKHDSPNAEESTAFLDKVKGYYRVNVYYPKFISLLTQGVGITDISQADFENKQDQDEGVHVIFEPELNKIMEFFQNQVRLILFQRVLLEADLARTAARLLTMSAAEEHTDELIKVQKRAIGKSIGSIKNRQLLETFSGLSKWIHH